MKRIGGIYKGLAANMQKIITLFSIFLSIFISGCSTVSPNALGISDTQWQQYTHDQRQEIINNYHLSKKDRKVSNGKIGASTIMVSVKGGKALLLPSSVPGPYVPLSFELKEGDCNHKFLLVSQDDSKKRAKLIACYKDKILYLDPSPYDADQPYGSIQFPYMPIWKRGFMYPNVNSEGTIKFTGVNVYVKQES